MPLNRLTIFLSLFPCFHIDDCSSLNMVSAQVEYLLEKYEWIVDEKKYFGQPNTAYDFEANDPKEANRRIQKLQSTKDKLSKSVNMRAMNMLGKAEEQVLLLTSGWLRSSLACISHQGFSDSSTMI